MAAYKDIGACPGYERAPDTPLGAGVAGVAFKERDVSTGEWVAIKYIPLVSVRAPGLALQQRARARPAATDRRARSPLGFWRGVCS
jgi:hypothetical protein